MTMLPQLGRFNQGDADASINTIGTLARRLPLRSKAGNYAECMSIARKMQDECMYFLRVASSLDDQKRLVSLTTTLDAERG